MAGAVFAPGGGEGEGGGMLVSGGADGSVRVWGAQSREQVVQFQVRKGARETNVN